MNLILLSGGILVLIVLLWSIAYQNLKRDHIDFMQKLEEFEKDFDEDDQT